VTWALQWQPQGKIGWRDTQIGPPNHASTLTSIMKNPWLKQMVLHLQVVKFSFLHVNNLFMSTLLLYYKKIMVIFVFFTIAQCTTMPTTFDL
jgi:hypothetical protein